MRCLRPEGGPAGPPFSIYTRGDKSHDIQTIKPFLNYEKQLDMKYKLKKQNSYPILKLVKEINFYIVSNVLQML